MKVVKGFGLVGGLLLTGACATQPPGQPEPAESGNAQSVEQAPGRCDAEKAQRFIGKPYTDVLGDEARQSSGAAILRPIRPGQAVTMDYREDRLNLELDENGTIVRARCG